MSAIVKSMMDEHLHAARMLMCGAEFEAGAAYDRIERAGAAITAASQAAASGNVIAGAPRTWAVRWYRVTDRIWWCVGFGSHVAPQVPEWKASPCWDATARVWRWGSPACDPRGCAWPRPWAGGEVRRG